MSKQLSEAVYGEITYELTPMISRKPIIETVFPLTTFSYDGYSYRIVDLKDPLVHRGSHIKVFQNLDRVMLSLNLPNCDITLGRQPISFGVARAVSPTDIITPYPYYTIDSENRIGVDASRAICSFSDLSQIDMGVVAGKDAKVKNSLMFISPSFNVAKNDIAPIFIYFKNNYLLGLNVQRPIWNMGFWVESAYVFAGTEKASIKNRNYFSLSTGMDYNFTDSIYAYLEYHYNGAGTVHKHNYLSNLFQVAYFEGNVYLMGKHYLIPSINYEISPLWNLNAVLFMNLCDLSASFNTVLEYNIVKNTYLDFNALINIGSPNSEFHRFSDRYYLAVRYYF
ncbi:MAG: hypothetical protein JW769_02005 [Parachlamydiales bacterium]|nr:hypothetical protein [Parachlamydiales bacterium]